MSRQRHTKSVKPADWKKNLPFIILFASIMIIGLGSMLIPEKEDEVVASASVPNETTTETISQPNDPGEKPRVLEEDFPPGEEPEHLFYDAERGYHWWEPHGHWHIGRPPAEPLASMVGINSMDELFNHSVAANQETDPDRVWGHLEYDAENDRYWHGPHQHFHPGKPTNY